MTKLPINLNDLLRQRTVEGERIAFVVRLPRHPLASAVDTPQASPQVITEATPQVTPQVITEATPQATPQVITEATPQVAPQVTPQVGALLSRLNGAMTRQTMQEALGLTDREHFRKSYLAPALEQGVIKMTRPDKPNSRSQRYRLTALGRQWLDTHSGDGAR